MFDKTIDKLEKEMMELNRLLTVEIPKELNVAAALGDLSENAEYDAAKEKKRITESRISQIQGRIRDIKNIDISKISKTNIGLGSIVSLEDVDSGDEVTYELVVADQVDIDAGKISIQAPIGRALMGKSEDDEVKVVFPAGKKEFLVNKVVTIHDRKSL